MSQSIEALERKIATPEFLSRLKVVSVDDNEFARKIMFVSLYGLGIRQVVEFDNARDALIYILRVPPDLIITDNMMPRLSGIEMTKIIRAKEKPIFKNVPIIMATAYPEEFRIQKALAVGFTSVLAKPFAPADLLSKIQMELKRSLLKATK